VWEILDNAIDEAMAGHCKHIDLEVHADGSVSVRDDGRGIPVDKMKTTGKSALETVLTVLHAGGKFGGEGYKVSGGLHGVGASVVNALSVYTKAEVHRDGGKYMQEYSQGKKKAAVKKMGSSNAKGTVITFRPDDSIFPDINFDFNRVVNHLRQQAYLVKGLRISVFDAREYKGKINDEKIFYFRELGLDVPSMSFYFEGGLLSLVKFYNKIQKPIHKNIFYIEKKTNDYESV
jgi:DNA gyrase subunit B